MNDTTIWPNDAQATLFAKPYKPGAYNKESEQTTIGQALHPLSDRLNRYPMSARGSVKRAAATKFTIISMR